MILNRTDSPINREGRNKLNENWETLERTYKNIVDVSYDAKTTAVEANEIAQGIDGKATQALNTANQANTKSDNAVSIATQKGDEAISIATAKGSEAVNTAKQKGDEAIGIANQANETSSYVQLQLDTVISESGDTNAEVIQARAEFVNLRARLDEEKAQIATQLAQNDEYLSLQKANAQVTLDIATYAPNTDNHAVHPFVLDSTSNYGYGYVMAFTPYSESRDRYENPSIVVSTDRYNWFVPNGVTNPIIPQPTTGYHYSDTMLLDNGAEIELWYRLTNKSNDKSKILMVKTSDLTTNPVVWTEPVTIFDYDQFDGSAYHSPCGFKKDGIYNIYYRASNGRYVLRTSGDLSTWSDAQQVNYDFGKYAAQGYDLTWHDEIKLIDGKYIAIVNTTTATSPDLFLFESTDGINFTVIKKIMMPSLTGFDSYRLYKSSLIKFGSWYYIYYSAFAHDASCYIALTKAPISTLEFTGMTTTDLEYHRKKSLETTTIYGQNKKAKVVMPNGVSVTGDGEIKMVNSGVAGVNLRPSRTDTLRINNDANTKSGYIEAAGIYFTSDNTAITQSLLLDGATYLHPTNNALIIYKNNARQRYARFVNLMISANGGDGTVNLYEGTDLIDSVVSDVYGVRINFKNIPSGSTPFVNVIARGADGISDGTDKAAYYYVREVGVSYALIGIKPDVNSAKHMPFNTCANGAIQVALIY